VPGIAGPGLAVIGDYFMYEIFPFAKDGYQRTGYEFDTWSVFERGSSRSREIVLHVNGYEFNFSVIHWGWDEVSRFYYFLFDVRGGLFILV